MCQRPPLNWLRWTIAVLVGLILTIALGTPARAQGGGDGYPGGEYYLGLRLLRQGAMPEAVEALEVARRRGRLDAQGRWIDSIPALVMLGEAHYQMGSLALAHQHFDAALELVVQHEGSLARIEWPPQLLAAGGARPTTMPWGISGRVVRLAALPERLPVLIGTLNPEAVVRGGGVLVPPQRVRVDVFEVLRCVGLALYRRSEILGPHATDALHDSVARAADRIAAQSPAVALPVWRTIQGMCRLAEGADQQAADLLEGGMRIGGLEHPLSPLAGLGIARILREASQTEGLRTAANDASVSAALLEQPEFVVEALRVGTATLAAGPDPPLLAASLRIAEVYDRTSPWVSAAAAVTAADAALAEGRGVDATTMVASARTRLSKPALRVGRLAALAGWVHARALAATGEVDPAIAAVAPAIAFAQGTPQQTSSPSLYQQQLQMAALRSDRAAGDRAEETLAATLAVPTLADWARDPLDALALATSPSFAARQMLLARAIERQDAAAVVSYADGILAARFRASLPLGGRMADLRWWIAQPLEMFSGDLLDQRQNLPGTMAEINEQVVRMRTVREALADVAWQAGEGDEAGDEGAAAQRETLWMELSEAANTAERLVHQMALDRVEIPRVMDMAEGTGAPAQVPPRTMVVTFVAAGRRMVAVSASATKVEMWEVPDSATHGARVGRVLAGMGVGRRRAGVAQLSRDAAWHESVRRLRSELLPPEHVDLDQVDRLVVVPAGPLWYLPFEILPVEEGADEILGDRLRISYAPTPTAAMARGADASAGETAGFVAGRLLAPRDAEADGRLVDGVAEAATTSVSLPEASPGLGGRYLSSVLWAAWIAAVQEAPSSGAAALGFAPLAFDARSGQGTLLDWMRFPWGAPRALLMPGFRTRLTGDGDEIFQVLMALRAAGCGEIVLARWPVGGPSTATLLRETMADLDQSPLLEAWLRAVQILRRQDLDPAAEPMLSFEDGRRERLTGDEPLFWSGYLVVQPN